MTSLQYDMCDVTKKPKRRQFNYNNNSKWSKNFDERPHRMGGGFFTGEGPWCSALGKVTAGLAESNGSLPHGGW